MILNISIIRMVNMSAISFLRRLPVVALALLCSGAMAQDIHFSQFANSPVNLNPGLVGVFGGDLRATANYKDQWRSVPVPYTTFSGTVENKVYWSKSKFDRYFTGGLLLNYDKQGSLSLTSMQVGLPVSVTLPVTKFGFLTVGATPAFGQRSFGTEKLTFDAQWNSRIYDPQAPTHENQLFQSQSLKYFDFSAGFNLRLQSPRKRSKLDIGGGIHHLNRPNHDFWSASLNNSGDVRLQDRKVVHANALVQLAHNYDLVVQGMYQRQGGYREAVYGAGLRMHLNRNLYKEMALQISLDFRHHFRDALIPRVDFFFKTWQIGFSYDVTALSEVKTITNKRGGPEVSVGYRLYRVKPIPKYKSCQLF